MGDSRLVLLLLLAASCAFACGPNLPSGPTDLLILQEGVELDDRAMSDLDGATHISLAVLEGKNPEVTVRLGDDVAFRRIPEMSKWLTVRPEDGLRAEIVTTVEGEPVRIPLLTPWIYCGEDGAFSVTFGALPLATIPKEELAPYAAALLADQPGSDFIVATDADESLDEVIQMLQEAGAGDILTLRR